jgi:hypothetical protein
MRVRDVVCSVRLSRASDLCSTPQRCPVSSLQRRDRPKRLAAEPHQDVICPGRSLTMPTISNVPTRLAQHAHAGQASASRKAPSAALQLIATPPLSAGFLNTHCPSLLRFALTILGFDTGVHGRFCSHGLPHLICVAPALVTPQRRPSLPSVFSPSAPLRLPRLHRA